MKSPARAHQLVTVAVGTLLTLVVGAVLVWGLSLATQITARIAALQSASVLQTYPSALARELGSLRDRLEARAYTGQVFADLKATNLRFEHELAQFSAGEFGRSQELLQAGVLWHQYAAVVNPVIGFKGQPYAESDATGSALSAAGSAHYADVKRAQLFTRDNAPRLQNLLAQSAATLQRDASVSADRLRLLLLAGALATFALGAVAAYLQVARTRHERIAREAREQTRDILHTVQEGFFLLDANYRIGSVWSSALTRMFGRKEFAGVAFEELLQGLVPEATLATATKYIKLLWGERAQESLMKSINPLGQLEIQVDNGRGGRDARYLQFDFHRVMGDGGVKRVLVSVADVTSNVLLARELAEAQQNANSQVDMMLGVMHIDPLQLASFLDATEAGLQLVNAILKEPARSDAEFRKKLAGLFRELHSIKGEATALNLASVAQRVHALEDLVSELNDHPELSGGDFLPLVLKLDDLLAHLRSVRELAMRVAVLRDSAVAGAAALQSPAERANFLADDLAATLQTLAERLGHEQQKRFRLSVHGFAHIPSGYRATVRDVLIQMLRNSAVHGIETADVRRAHAKSDVGLVRAEFRNVAGGYELVFEDDGAGLALEELKAAAIRKHVTTADEAARMDTRTTMGLIFRPGVSTHERVSMDAGRGVGMDVVARGIAALGGKIVLSTDPGKFTRFKIALPAIEAATSAVA
jgi:HPt (histidine-containing phosphotransfer) domain-containing protein/PAS domain-containing protein